VFPLEQTMSADCDETTATSGPWQGEYVQLFVANQRRIHAFIRTLVPNQADSEEVLQETSLTGWGKFAEVAAGLVGSPDSFVSWICTIARYEALKHYRKQKAYRIPFTEALLEDLAERQQRQTEYLEMRYRSLAICMQKLSTRDRELLQHRYGMNAKPKQIADRTGRPLNTIYKGLQRIRAALLECVDRVLRAEGTWS
jgi:RNA polymerase sigma-70 factor, ECF subfamily